MKIKSTYWILPLVALTVFAIKPSYGDTREKIGTALGVLGGVLNAIEKAKSEKDPSAMNQKDPSGNAILDNPRIDLGWRIKEGGMDQHGIIRICEPQGCNLFGKGDTWYFNNEVTTDYDLLKGGVICDVVKREVTDAERERLGKSYSVMRYAEFFVCGDDRNIAAAMKLEAEKKAALEEKRIALEKEKAEKARLAKIQKENEKREWQEELNKRRTQAAQWAPAYINREKSLMEEVFNFAAFGDPEGGLKEQNDGSFRGGAYEEGPKCVMTGHGIDSNGLRKVDPINARKINNTAFRMSPEVVEVFDWINGGTKFESRMRSTDHKVIDISGPETIAMDRLQKAWGLAFSECPGKKSRF